MRAHLMTPLCCWAWLLLASAGCGEDVPTERESCETNADCTLPRLCDDQQQCALPPPAAEGEPCSHDDHCTSGACLDLGDGAVCLTTCVDDGACAAEQRCAHAAARGPEAASPQKLHFICQQPAGGPRFVGEACQQDSDCSSGLCHQDRCSSPCGQCPGRLACTEATITRADLTLSHGVCTPAPPLEAVELGAVSTPATGAQPLSFEVPAGLRSFVIVAEDQDDLWVSILRLEGPDGALLIDSESPATSPMRASHYVGVSTALVPGTDDPALAVKAGTYKVTLGTFDPKKKVAEGILEAVDGELDRVALVLKREGAGSGLLDLNIHFSPGTGLTADTAAEEEYFANTLARMKLLYRTRFGVGLGEVQLFDLPETEDQVLDGDDARNICRHHSKPGPNGTSINLFIVKTLDFAGGFSGGIPGAPGLYGRPGSGIVLRKYNDYTTMGTLLAHEVGHFLGLFHTTELSGLVDPISDTESCPSQTPVEQCPDSENLMFPNFKSGGALNITDGQAGVLRGNPALYEVTYPDVCGEGVEGVDLSKHGYASGVISGASSHQGSCGGGGQPERVHLFRLEEQLESLEIEVRGHGFSPAVYVRHTQCAEAAKELSCETAAAGESGKITLDNPAPGAYFIIVDGADGAGRYDLSLSLIRPPAE